MVVSEMKVRPMMLVSEKGIKLKDTAIDTIPHRLCSTMDFMIWLYLKSETSFPSSNVLYSSSLLLKVIWRYSTSLLHRMVPGNFSINIWKNYIFQFSGNHIFFKTIWFQENFNRKMENYIFSILWLNKIFSNSWNTQVRLYHC